MGRIFTVIDKRSSDKKLSQAPAPTVRGTSNHVGTTTILEPCAVLDPALFQSTLGMPETDPVQRSGLELKPTKRGDYRPGSSCDRQYSADQLVNGATLSAAEQPYGGGYAAAHLSIDFSPSVKDAHEYWKSFTGEDDRPIQTSADEAFLSTTDYTGTPSTIGYFRVGPYVGTVDLTLAKEDEFGDLVHLTADDATLTKLVDAVAKKIIAKKGAIEPVKD